MQAAAEEVIASISLLVIFGLKSLLKPQEELLFVLQAFVRYRYLDVSQQVPVRKKHTYGMPLVDL